MLCLLLGGKVDEDDSSATPAPRLYRTKLNMMRSGQAPESTTIEDLQLK